MGWSCVLCTLPTRRSETHGIYQVESRVSGPLVGKTLFETLGSLSSLLSLTRSHKMKSSGGKKKYYEQILKKGKSKRNHCENLKSRPLKMIYHGNVKYASENVSILNPIQRDPALETGR